MKARFLRYAALEDLRDQVASNLSSYRSGNFNHIEVDGSWWFEHEAQIDEEKLINLKSPAGQNLYEVENCELFYGAMKEISPYDARDERLWVYLTHTILLDYTRRRWVIPSDDELAIAYIRKHFFARDKRQVERDNAASRLWWMAHLCARIPSVAFNDALKVFLFKSDVRASIVERPTSSQSLEVFGAIVNRLSTSLGGEQLLFERDTFRNFMRELNSVGGFKLLDCMTKKQVESTLDVIIHDRLALAVL